MNPVKFTALLSSRFLLPSSIQNSDFALVSDPAALFICKIRRKKPNHETLGRLSKYLLEIADTVSEDLNAIIHPQYNFILHSIYYREVDNGYPVRDLA